MIRLRLRIIHCITIVGDKLSSQSEINHLCIHNEQYRFLNAYRIPRTKSSRKVVASPWRGASSTNIRQSHAITVMCKYKQMHLNNYTPKHHLLVIPVQHPNISVLWLHLWQNRCLPSMTFSHGAILFFFPLMRFCWDFSNRQLLHNRNPHSHPDFIIRRVSQSIN